MIVKAGTILTFCTGEYSDQFSHPPHKVLIDFDQEALVEVFSEEHPEPESTWDEDRLDKFIPWMTKHGYVEQVEGSVYWHIGSYGRFEPEIIQAHEEVK